MSSNTSAIRMVRPLTHRRWTREENRVLVEYINSHLGHCDGLHGDYWDELSEVLNKVREDGDTVLEKQQVRSKIQNLGKKGFSFIDILQYGTNVGAIQEAKTLERRSKSNASLEQPASVEGPTFPLDDSCHHTLSQTDPEAATMTETIALGSPVAIVSNGPRCNLKTMSNQDTPPQPQRTDILQHCTEPQTKQDICTGSKRSKSDDSCSVSTNGRTKGQKRRLRRRIAQVKQAQRESEPKRPAFGILNDSCNGQDSLYINKQMNEEPVEEAHSSQVQVKNDIVAIPWQDQIFLTWQRHLACQDLILIAPREPMHHRNILFTIEDISKHIQEAGESIQNMFPYPWDFSFLGSSGPRILSVLTGKRAHYEAEDMLKIAQSLPPLSAQIDLICVMLGATIHQWIFEDFRLPTSRLYDHDIIRTLFDEFIARDCPKLWTSYQSLYQYQFLSAYNEERIVSEAEKLTNDAYALLSAAGSTIATKYASPINKLAFSTAFPIQAQHYQSFKNNMIEAYRLALDLRVALAKCSDLTYEFHFPAMRDSFDASCMDVRISAGVDDVVVSGEDRCIAVCFLPSIWSRARSEGDYGKPSTLVTKAIVLL